jgi:hypothetical protein
MLYLPQMCGSIILNTLLNGIDMNLQEWVASEKENIADSPLPVCSKPPIVIALLVFGKPYAERCIRMFRCWLGEGNLEALTAQREVYVFLNTTPETEEFLRQSPEFHKLSYVKFTISYAPKEVLEGDKIAVLTANHHLALYYAKHIGAEFHTGAPDLLYCTNYFRDILRIAKDGHGIIFQPVLCAQEENLADVTVNWNSNEPLHLDAPTLCFCALAFMHRCDINQQVQLGRLLVNKYASYPEHQQMLWMGTDYVRIASVNMNTTYLSAKMVCELPEIPFEPLDGIPQFTAGDKPFYTPQKGDNLVMVEYSPADSKTGAFNHNDLNGAAQYLVTRCTKQKLRFFFQDSYLPISQEPKRNPNLILADARMESEMKNIRERIKNAMDMPNIQSA